MKNIDVSRSSQTTALVSSNTSSTHMKMGMALLSRDNAIDDPATADHDRNADQHRNEQRHGDSPWTFVWTFVTE